MSIPPAFTGMALFSTPRHQERPARGSLASQPIPENSPILPIQYSTPNMPVHFSTPPPQTPTCLNIPSILATFRLYRIPVERWLK